MEPLNPHFPAEDQLITWPTLFVRATMTLLKVDETCASPMASTLTTLFFVVVVFFAIIHRDLLGCLLLVCNGLLLTLTCTGIVLGALSANREADTMADASVATDIHKALDVHRDG